jgi:hypothetical protein
MSVSKFCKAEGLCEETFYGRRRRLSSRHSQQTKPTHSKPSAFIEVAMPKDDPIAVELLLCSGHTLRIRSSADNETLSKVLSTLQQVGLC